MSSKNGSNVNDIETVEKIDAIRACYDYEVAITEGKFFIRTEDFTIEIRDVKLTTPPDNWCEKDFGIFTFTFDIISGEQFIKEMGTENFEMMIGPWVCKEVENKNG